MCGGAPAPGFGLFGEVVALVERERGVFPGAARCGDLVGVCMYGFDEWARFFGGDAEAYRDYLIEQARFVAGERSRGRRVVRVPFVEPEFGAWLASRSGVEAGPEAHGEWAVEVASDPDALRRVRAAVPALPAAPEEEEFVDLVRVLLLWVFVASESEAKSLSRPFPGDVCRQAAEAFAAALECSRVRRLSRLRAEGAWLVPGTRLVAPLDAEDAAGFLEGNLCWAFQAVGDDFCYAVVPRRLRVEPDGPVPNMLVLALPVVLCGARWDVEREDDRLSRGEGAGALLAGARLLVESLGVPWRMGDCPPEYGPAWDAAEHAEEMAEKIDVDGPLILSRLTRGGGRPDLRRVK